MRKRKLKDEPEFISMDVAIDHIMQTTGKTRRQARYALIDALRRGEIEAHGRRSDTNELEAIPPEAWPKVN